MGEVTECATLKEAFRIYQKMEQKRSGMGLGLDLFYMIQMCLSTVISTILYIKEMGWSDLIALVEAYEKHPLVQKAQKICRNC